MPHGTSLTYNEAVAAWKATKTTGQYDMKTFEVKASPAQKVDGLRPGMSVLME